MTLKFTGQIARLPVLMHLPGCAVGAPPSARFITGRAAAPASNRGGGAAPTAGSLKFVGIPTLVQPACGGEGSKQL
jgi:hypothetical protein